MRHARLLVPALLFVAACSGKTVIGSVEGSLKKNPDGSPTGNGTSCSYGGTTVNVGDKFKAPDGCNTCTCTEQGAACTEMACVSDGGTGAGGCADATGKRYAVGQSWTCDDGCNTCSCRADGQVAQTLRACASKCEAPGACGPAPKSPSFNCIDGTVAGPSCSEAGGACRWVVTSCTCTDGAFKHQPGDSWDDGCNTCACESNGSIACTKKACTCPPPGTVIDCMPNYSTPKQQNECAGPYHDFLVKNCTGVTFAL